MQATDNRQVLLGLFLGCAVGFLILFANRPTMDSPLLADLHFPPSPKDLFQLGQVRRCETQFLLDYKSEHELYVLFSFVYLFSFLQAFAIPGPIFLCVLSPLLYGPLGGFFLSISVKIELNQCACFGASLCYLVSWKLARKFVLNRFPDLFGKFNKLMEQNSNNQFWFMLFLRLTPMVPNWFVNLGSPLVGMPYKHFLVGSFIGMMPMNFILIQTGMTLRNIDSIGVNSQSVFLLFCLGILALIPVFISKFQTKKQINSQHQTTNIPKLTKHN